jgi:putative lipoprotein
MISISGALVYRERIALIPGGTATITLRDLAPRGSAAVVLAETTIELGHRQIPIPFELTVDRLAPSPGRAYGLTATITGPGHVLEWITPTPHRLDADQGRLDVGPLLLVRAAGVRADPGAASPIIGEWRVTVIGTDPVITDSSPTMTFGADGSLVGNAGCNSYSTTYTTAASGLSIDSAIATTSMACDPATERQERAFLGVLDAIAADDGASTFEVDDSGGQLALTSSDGATLVASSWPKRSTIQ